MAVVNVQRRVPFACSERGKPTACVVLVMLQTLRGGNPAVDWKLSVMLEIGKQGKRKGRGTCRVKMHVCTRGWRSTRTDLRSARNGTNRDIALDDISPFFAAVAPASPELRR